MIIKLKLVKNILSLLNNVKMLNTLITIVRSVRTKTIKMLQINV